MSDINALKFGATWCAPCKLIEPKLEKMKEEFPQVQFRKIDVDDEYEMAEKYQIKSVPTVILLKDGLEVFRITGATLITPLRKAFSDLVGGGEEAA